MLYLVVVAADNSGWFGGLSGCTDNLVRTGYRIETPVTDEL